MMLPSDFPDFVVPFSLVPALAVLVPGFTTGLFPTFLRLVVLALVDFASSRPSSSPLTTELERARFEVDFIA